MGLLKKVAILIVALMIISAFLIVRDKNLNLTRAEDIKQFGSEYVKWAGNSVKNVASVTSYVVKLDWLPRN